MKKWLLSFGIGTAAMLIVSMNAFAVTLPAPDTIVNGVPVARQFDQFFSYPTQLLSLLGFSDFDSPAGLGTLDVVVLAHASGASNAGVGTGGLFTFEDPALSPAGNNLSFADTWGAGLRDNGPVSVDNMLNYLHNQFGPTQNVPVFTFDLAEPPGNRNNPDVRDLDLVAKFLIWDPAANGGLGAEVASWAFDANNNGSFDPLAWTLAEGHLEITGADNTLYAWDTNGSGTNDFLAFSPFMDLSLYSFAETGKNYEFHIYSAMQRLDNGGEEAWISGAIQAPTHNAVPEPITVTLFGLGLGGLALRRKK